MFAVGITDNINIDELEAIGVDGFWTSVDFQHLSNLLQELTSVQCLGGKYEEVRE